MTNEDLPTNEELKEEILRLANVRQGEINEWASEGDSFVFMGNHGSVMRSMKDEYIDVRKEYETLENDKLRVNSTQYNPGLF